MDSDAAERAMIAQYVGRILTDTGFCCRNLLGWNYDEGIDGEKFNVGTGGVRDSGSHKLMVDMIDRRETRYKMLQAPRGSYKSTILQGFIIRNILLNPDVRIIYCSAREDVCNEKAIAVRAALESESVTRLFGDQRGEPWENTRFTVKGRKQKNLQTPTFLAFSLESMVVGARGNIVILDDPIDQANCTNTEMLAKSKKNFEMMLPFVAKGGTLIVVGTRYAADDLYNDLEQSKLFQPPNGESLILGAGVRVVKHEKTGLLTLVEEESGLTFPHMTMEFLQEKLAGMSITGDFTQFCCQYLNYVPAGTGSSFQRWMFQPIRWEEDMEQLTGYLLTDTAVSDRDEGCYSVIAYVCLDAADNIYLMDLRVGHWEPREFVNVFFDVLKEWSPKVNHCGECWEDVALATSFEHSVREYAIQKRLKLNTITMKRWSQESKSMRVNRLQQPLFDRKFYVVDTVPRTFDDLDGPKVLWNPEGFFDSRTKTAQPDGELVQEFIRFKAAGMKQDIPDTLAMILEYEKANGSSTRRRRYCSYKPFKRKDAAMSLTEERKSQYFADTYRSATSGDWWERTIRDVSNPGF